MKYRMLPRARSWVGWHALAPCVVRECAGASLETGSFFRPGSALLARKRGLSGRDSLVCCIEVCIGIVYWSCVRPGFACPDPSCVCGERYQPSCVCDGAVCADVRCVWSSTVFGRTKAGWQRWVVSIVGNVRSFHVTCTILGMSVTLVKIETSPLVSDTYSISQEICTRFCCALLCCGYAIVHNEFTWSIYPYSSGLLYWHWGNRYIATVPVK